MNRLIAGSLVWFFATAVAPIHGQTEDPLGDLLDKLDERTAQVADLTAMFTQRRHSILLREPLVSKGRVWVLGDTIKWETIEPRASVMLVNNRSARLFDQEANRVEVYPLSAGIAAIIGTPLPRFSRLKESFLIERVQEDVESELIVLKLSPLNEELAEHIKSVTVWIDPTIPATTILEVVDAEGDRTKITFSKIKLNQGLEESDFELELPDDVTIEYPMGPIPKSDGL